MDQELIAAERANYKGKVFAYAAMPNMHFRGKSGFMLGVAVLGEAGYSPRPQFFDDFSSAHEAADRLNAELGLDADTAVAIVADTMARSQRKNDDEAGLTTVKLSAEDLRELMEALEDADLSDDRTYEKLEEALNDLQDDSPRLGR